MHVAPLRLPPPKELLADPWKIRYNKRYSVWRFCVNPVAEPSCVFFADKTARGAQVHRIVLQKCVSPDLWICAFLIFI